ncbi:hypothetical protein [Paenibacillus harenae]|uniref:hypothetical protein n=1 Tax=Paenibacillus harenae TaxID=306543 RepID=UPI00042A171A|nr:hypothetical protein [Paenibacillus harenae]
MAVVIIAVQVIIGAVNTAMYVPDIMNSYESVDDLQHEVSFGKVRGGNWIIEGAVCLIAGAVYYGVRLIIRSRRR